MHIPHALNKFDFKFIFCFWAPGTRPSLTTYTDGLNGAEFLIHFTIYGTTLLLTVGTWWWEARCKGVT